MGYYITLICKHVIKLYIMGDLPVMGYSPKYVYPFLQNYSSLQKKGFLVYYLFLWVDWYLIFLAIAIYLLL